MGCSCQPRRVEKRRIRSAGLGKMIKQKRKARTGFNPKTQQKIRIPAKTVLKFRVAKVVKDTVLGGKK